MSDGMKFDNGKIRTDLVEPDFILDVASVLTFGANKYAPNNWQNVDDPVNRYYAATLRHLLAWRNGEQIDPESGCNHLAHVATNIMFLLHFDRSK